MIPMVNVTILGRARRAIWQTVRRYGLTQNPWGYTELPAAASSLPEVDRLGLAVSRLMGETYSVADPVQLLLRLPDEDTDWAAVQYEPHVDKTPTGGIYRRVLGCTLTDAPYGSAQVGELIFGVRAGECYGWPGDTEHHGLPNRGSEPRLTAYWRFR